MVTKEISPNGSESIRMPSWLFRRLAWGIVTILGVDVSTTIWNNAQLREGERYTLSRGVKAETKLDTLYEYTHGLKIPPVDVKLRLSTLESASFTLDDKVDRNYDLINKIFIQLKGMEIHTHAQ